MDELTHLDLFSGIGGFALAARRAGFRTIGFCEINEYCQRVLAKNFGAEVLAYAGRNGGRENVERRKSKGRTALGRRGEDVAYAGRPSDESHGRSDETSSANGTAEGEAQQWERRGTDSGDSSPIIFTDIRELDGTQFRRNDGCNVTLLTGGFPCQPFSVAGKRRGAADDRHLWPEMLRVIKEARPAWVLGENVPGIIPMELDNVLSALESIGYACRPFVIPACGVDARHRRDRLWIVADDSRIQQGWKEQWPERERIGQGRESIDVADTGEQFRERSERNGNATRRNGFTDVRGWQPEPDVGRVAHGIPSRVDRLRGLGNAIVPQVAYEILKGIREEIMSEANQWQCAIAP